MLTSFGFVFCCCGTNLTLQRGNRHYQSQQYKDAHQSYSEALALNVEDPTFNAVLLCNRAAALHSMGQYLEAIADCCMAAKLDDKYPRVLQVGTGFGIVSVDCGYPGF